MGKVVGESAAWFGFTVLEIFIILFQFMHLNSEQVRRYHFREYTAEIGESSGKIYTENISLFKGVYDVAVEYQNNGGILLYKLRHQSIAKDRTLYDDRVSLPRIIETNRTLPYGSIMMLRT